MTVQDVRDYHLQRLDTEFAQVRKMVGNPAFVCADSDDYKRLMGTVIDRINGLAAFNSAAQPAQNASKRNGSAPKTIAPVDTNNVLDAILASPEAN